MGWRPWETSRPTQDGRLVWTKCKRRILKGLSCSRVFVPPVIHKIRFKPSKCRCVKKMRHSGNGRRIKRLEILLKNIGLLRKEHFKKSKSIEPVDHNKRTPFDEVHIQGMHTWRTGQSIWCIQKEVKRQSTHNWMHDDVHKIVFLYRDSNVGSNFIWRRTVTDL